MGELRYLNTSKLQLCMHYKEVLGGGRSSPHWLCGEEQRGEQTKEAWSALEGRLLLTMPLAEIMRLEIFFVCFQVFRPVATPCEGEFWHLSGGNKVLYKKKKEHHSVHLESRRVPVCV